MTIFSRHIPAIFRALALAALVLGAAIPAAAQASTQTSSSAAPEKKKVPESVDMDPALYEYLLKCQHSLSDPNVLVMLDTLFQRAADLHDERTQAAALCEKAVYFNKQPHSEANLDSLKKYTAQAQEFAKTSNQMRYYFWIWMRFAEYYLKHGQYSLAIFETDRLRKEADAADNADGQISALKVLARIYNNRRDTRRAAEYMRRAIEISEKQKEPDFNLSTSYARLATFETSNKNYGAATKALERAEETARTDAQRSEVYMARFSYARAHHDLPEMQRYYDMMMALDVPPSMNQVSAEYYMAMERKDYEKALEMEEKMHTTAFDPEEQYLLRMARIYAKMPGRDRQAIEYYERFTQYVDSMSREENYASLDDLDKIMEIQELEMEKKDLAISMEEEKNKSLMIVTSIFVLLAVVLLYLLMRTLKGRRLGM